MTLWVNSSITFDYEERCIDIHLDKPSCDFTNPDIVKYLTLLVSCTLMHTDRLTELLISCYCDVKMFAKLNM